MWFDLPATEVQKQLGMEPQQLLWLQRGSHLVGRNPVELPGDTEAESLLTDLGVTKRDRRETLRSRPHPSKTPALWWVLERAFGELVENMGGTRELQFPSLPERTGSIGRHLYVWLYLAATPLVRRYHHHRAIPDHISWGSLSDLGRKMNVYRQIYEKSGLHTQSWLSQIFCGSVYELGRFQFHVIEMPFDMSKASTCATAPRLGDRVLALHAPTTGPLQPDACDRSIKRGIKFFRHYFPEWSFDFLVAVPTWLLDRQLAEYLPVGSNILSFQRRFHIAPMNVFPDPVSEWTHGDRAVMEFVFHRVCPTAPPRQVFDQLPQETTLQRAAAKHFQSGKHWHVRSGWLPIEDV